MKQKLHLMFDSNVLFTLKTPEYMSSIDIKRINLRKKSWCFNSGFTLCYFEVLFLNYLTERPEKLPVSDEAGRPNAIK